MSWMEVEAKVRVDNIKEVERKIKKIAKFIKKHKIEDTYYTFKTVNGYPEERFRIRKTDGKYVINFKRRKDLPFDIQAKEEFEFQIRDKKVFEEFLKEFNFKQFVHKIKESKIYRYKDINIEVNNVKHLGYFLEIEILCPKNKVREAKQKINRVLKLLKIKPSQIERRGYTRMLYNKGIRW